MVKTTKHTKATQPTIPTSGTENNPDDNTDNDSDIYKAASATNDGSELESSDGTEIAETISNDKVCFKCFIFDTTLLILVFY